MNRRHGKNVYRTGGNVHAQVCKLKGKRVFLSFLGDLVLLGGVGGGGGGTRGSDSLLYHHIFVASLTVPSLLI